MNEIKKSLFVVTVSFFINLTVAILSNVPAQAKCLIIPTLKRLKQSRAVFIGEALDIKKGVGNEQVRFRITRSWKGVSRGEVVISNTRHHEAPHYEVSKSYLVFAFGDKDELATGICSGTVDVEYAQTEIKELEKWKRQKRIRKSASFRRSVLTKNPDNSPKAHVI